ncbi:MAG: hypothetical protein ACREIA_01175 [Opitutaceae bacterium]
MTRRTLSAFVALGFGAASVAASPAAPQPARQVAVTIDPSISHQTIEGFGATFVDWQDPKEYSDPAFFDTVVYDLGLSILRIPLLEEIEPYNDDDDPDHFNWDGFMTGDVDAHWSFTKRMEFAEEFKKRGVTRFYSSIYTPPAFTKTTRADNYGGYLRADMLESGGKKGQAGKKRAGEKRVRGGGMNRQDR